MVDKLSLWFLVVLGVVLVVGLVVVGKGGIQGAPVYKTQLDEYQTLCTDSDPTNDWYTAGSVKYGKTQYFDFCQNGMISQHYCATDNQVRQTSSFACPKGCINGACVR